MLRVIGVGVFIAIRRRILRQINAAVGRRLRSRARLRGGLEVAVAVIGVGLHRLDAEGDIIEIPRVDVLLIGGNDGDGADRHAARFLRDSDRLHILPVAVIRVAGVEVNLVAAVGIIETKNQPEIGVQAALGLRLRRLTVGESIVFLAVLMRKKSAGSAGLPLSDSFPPCVVSALLTGQFAQSPVIYAAHCALICFISLIYLSGKVPSSE